MRWFVVFIQGLRWELCGEHLMANYSMVVYWEMFLLILADGLIFGRMMDLYGWSNPYPIGMFAHIIRVFRPIL